MNFFQKQSRMFSIFLILLCLILNSTLSAQDYPAHLFQEARYAEEVMGDLEEAMRLYKLILGNPSLMPGTGISSQQNFERFR